jgi:hypothetical protein
MARIIDPFDFVRPEEENLEKVTVIIEGIHIQNPAEETENLLQELNKRPHLKNPTVSFNQESKQIKVEVEVDYLLGVEYVREEMFEIAAAILQETSGLKVEILDPLQKRAPDSFKALKTPKDVYQYLADYVTNHINDQWSKAWIEQEIEAENADSLKSLYLPGLASWLAS